MRLKLLEIELNTSDPEASKHFPADELQDPDGCRIEIKKQRG